MPTRQVTTHGSGATTAVARSYAAPRMPLAEVQISFHDPDAKGRGKLVAIGIPPDEIRQVAATVIDTSYAVADLERAIQVRLVGAEKYQRRYGLALGVALMAGVTMRKVPEGHLFLGEIDLHRKVRDLPKRVIESLLTSLAEGEIETPVTLVVPESAEVDLVGSDDVKVIACATVTEVAERIWAK